MPAWLQAIVDFAALYLTEICLSMLALFMVLWLTVIARARRRRSLSSGGSGSFLKGSQTAALPGYLQKFLQLWSQHGEVTAPRVDMEVEFCIVELQRVEIIDQCVDVDRKRDATGRLEIYRSKPGVELKDLGSVLAPVDGHMELSGVGLSRRLDARQ